MYGRIRWKHLAALKSGKSVFIQHAVRFPNFLAAGVMLGQAGNCFQKTVHTTWIYPGPFSARRTAVVLGSESP